MSKQNKSYALYDYRYLDDPDRAMCLSMCETLKAAKKDRKNFFEDSVLVECTWEQQKDGSRLITNEKIIY